MTAEVLKASQAAETAEKIEREKVRLAFGSWTQHVDGIPFACGIAVMLSGAWPALGNTNPWVAAAWTCVFATWSVTMACIWRYYQTHEAQRPVRFWQSLQVGTAVIYGLVWGSLIWVFWEPGNTANQAVLCIIGLGVMVAAFFLAATSFAFLCASLSTLAVVIWGAFFVHGGTLAEAFLVLFPLFLLLLLRYGWATAHNYHEAFRLRFENEALAKALASASRAKSDFLASISHELRTPLNSIIGYSDLIRQETFGPVTPVRYAGYVEDIAASGAHLLKMINDLLDLAKIEAGKREYQSAPVRLSDVAADAMRFVEPMAARAHVSLMFDAKHAAVVRADERAVKQMMINLLSNAVKFSRPGGIAVVFAEILADNRVAFGVKDTGIGMTAEERQKATEPFEQASTIETVEGRGTGLGLPLVIGLIDAHQGRLRIESTKGVGSKIWVEFPPERLMRTADMVAA
jgi:signal transduction histidine kinase